MTRNQNNSRMPSGPGCCCRCCRCCCLLRNPSEAAVSALAALPGASERLKLFHADLLSPGSFDAAVGEELW